MGKPSEASKTQDLELTDEWPIDLEGRMEGLMVEADEGKVLAALKLPSDYTDGCFVFDINNRTCQSENWFWGCPDSMDRPIGKGPACVVMEGGSLKVVLAVTTEIRNQRGGFLTLLDPQLLTILDIAEIPDASGVLARSLPGRSAERYGQAASEDWMISMRRIIRDST
ncbi:MAG: hypothetical protein ACK6BG_01490 [Cyanobacteriota bacterium]